MPFIDFDDPSARLNLLETLEPRSDPANPIVEEVRALLKLPGCLATSDQQRILDYFHQCLGERGIESLFRRAQPFAEQSSSLPKRSIKAAEASTTPVPPINSEERERLYQQFIAEKSQRVLAHLESHDRGLANSPMGNRDILGKVLTRLIEGDLSPRFKTLLQKKMVLIVQGKENQERWRKRLEGIFGERRQVGHHQQVLWEKNGVQVQLATIHELSRLPRPDLKMFMDETGLVILDKEHHVRPVEDHPEDLDRKRFARVLIEAGLLTEDFQAQSQEGKCLLSFTETVSEGAKLVYRGKEGLIFSETLPELLARGFIKKPEVRAILPKGFTGETPVYDAWKALSLEERVEASLTSILTVDEELSRRKPPRIVVYAGSREEAESLAQHLEVNPRYHHQTALMISGDQETEKRRVEEGKEFFDGTRAIAIHVEALVEGVDEFQKRPVDAVIFSGAERAGGLRYALQSVGAHLISGEKPPLFIDQAGMFFRHPDLMAFNPEIYLIEEGKIRKGSPLSTLPSRPRTRGKEILKEVDILTIDIFGEGIGKNISRFLGGFLFSSSQGEKSGISRSAIALELGWSEEIILKILKGEFLPQSRAMMEKFAQALNLNISDQAQLLNEWAIDRMRYYEQFHPIPHHLSDQERLVLKAVRRGLILHYGGRWEPKSIPLNRYLETGGWPEHINHKRELSKILPQIIHGNLRIKEGWDFLRKNIKKGFLIQIWIPTTPEEVRETTLERLEDWFKGVEQELGKPTQKIILQFQLANGKYAAFQSLAIGTEKNVGNYGKITISRKKGKTVSYEIVMKSGKGKGADDFIKYLRKAEGLKDVLEIRSHGWMIENASPTLEEMEDCRKEDLEQWFEEVGRATKSNPQEIILQFKLAEGKLTGFQPLAVGMENENDSYGKITIRRRNGKAVPYEIVTKSGKGGGTANFIESLRKAKGLNDILEIRSNGWMIESAASTLEEMENCRKEDLEQWFEEVGRATKSNPQEIILQFKLIEGKLTGFQPLAVGMENKAQGHGKVTIRRRNGKAVPYEIVTKSGKGGGAANFIESLRKAKGLNDILEIRSNGWIIERAALTFEEVQDCRKEDLERWFDEVKGATQSNPKEIVLQFKVIGGKLTSFQPIAVGMEKGCRSYGKIFIRQKENSLYEIYSAEAYGSNKFLEQVQTSSLTRDKIPVLKITGKALRILNDFEETTNETRAEGHQNRRLNRESGFSTIELLSLGTAKGIEKISPFVYSGARSVGSNALIFGIGEYGSNWVTGHKNRDLWEFSKMFGVQAIVGGSAQTLVDGLFNLFERKSFFEKAIPFTEKFSWGGFGKTLFKRAVPLSCVIFAGDLFEGKTSSFWGMGLGVFNVFLASGVTHGIGSVIGALPFMTRYGEGLKFFKEIAKMGGTLPWEIRSVLFGIACVTSITEFTLLKWIGSGEEKLFAYFQDSRNFNDRNRAMSFQDYRFSYPIIHPQLYPQIL